MRDLFALSSSNDALHLGENLSLSTEHDANATGMPYHDLNVPWTDGLALQRTLTFLDELGYHVVALSHTISGKLAGDITCPIPAELPFPTPKRMKILRRCTLIFSEPAQNYRMSELAAAYDILALRPTNEKALQMACEAKDCDIISLDMTQFLGFFPKMKTVGLAIERGVPFEICYAPGVSASDGNTRRNVISNATQLVRSTRGRGLVISSEAGRAASCRGPEDVINLAAVWGLGQEKGKEAMEKLARAVVTNAGLRRTSFRGTIDVIYGGDRDIETETTAPPQPQSQPKATNGTQKKRKADATGTPPQPEGNVMPLSKREQKRRRKAQVKSEEQPQTAGSADALT